MIITSRRALLGTAILAPAVLPTLFSRKAFSQQTKTPTSKMAVVVSAQQQIIYANASDGPLTVVLGTQTQVWKGRNLQDFAEIRPGDQILVRGRQDATGRMIAANVWANIISVYGMVVGLNDSGFQILPYSPEPTGSLTSVVVDANTLGQLQERVSMTNIQKGRFVQVIGAAAQNGKIQAARVLVYVNGRPVNAPPAISVVGPRTGG